MSADRAPFGVLPDGRPAALFTLGAEGVTARVTDLGATLVGLETPDRTGRVAGVVLGLADAAGYASREPGANPFLGATVGRVANRTAGAAFELDGARFEVDANEPPNHLHGGRTGSFERELWDVVDAGPDRVLLRLVSPDGTGGYPGTVTATAEYAAAPGELRITYRATTDRATPVNMTQHAYLNLAGEDGATVLDHELAVAADRWTPVDAGLIPTGETPAVDGTPYDLRAARRLGAVVAALADDLAGGMDHNLWLEGTPGGLREVAVLRDPASGRWLRLDSDQPCLQVYTGNRLGRTVGRGGVTFPRHGAVCLEPQHAPDSLHRPAWPSIVLRPGEEYVHRLRYRLGAD
ncbi:MAG: aldose epimerase family protein [Nitriliruptoraceae bacterium]